MTDWAKELAEKIKLQEESRRREEFRQQERTRLFASKVPQLWREFISVMEKDLEEFNKVFASEASTRIVFQRGPGTRFRLHWAFASRDQLEVLLDLERQVIEYRLSRKGLSEGVFPEKTGILSLPMNEAGEISLRNEEQTLTLDEASELLLRPVLSWGVGSDKHPA